MERWLPIQGFEGRYEVSDQGQVRALFVAPWRPRPPRIIGGTRGPNRAYRGVNLTAEDGTRTSWLVHALVMRAFVGPMPPGMECRHLDGDPDNCALTNLRWGTKRQNGEDMVRHGRSTRGERQPHSKLTADDVRQIRRLSARGWSRGRVAERYGVVPQTISDILRGKSWGWLT